MLATATHEEVAEGCVEVGEAWHGPGEEEVVDAECAVEDVATGESKYAFEVGGQQHVLVHN